jgi:UDP-2,3-diacylglucosamine pyrophosphatase LpxH
MATSSMSAYLKHRTNRAVDFVGRFEGALIAEAKRRNLDGVICGHIHTAEFKEIDGITYCNDGDWVESCTALVEHEDGSLEILNWSTTACELASQPTSLQSKPERAAA